MVQLLLLPAGLEWDRVRYYCGHFAVINIGLRPRRCSYCSYLRGCSGTEFAIIAVIYWPIAPALDDK
jgi:hypothetical protein